MVLGFGTERGVVVGIDVKGGGAFLESVWDGDGSGFKGRRTNIKKVSIYPLFT